MPVPVLRAPAVERAHYELIVHIDEDLRSPETVRAELEQEVVQRVRLLLVDVLQQTLGRKNPSRFKRGCPWYRPHLPTLPRKHPMPRK